MLNESYFGDELTMYGFISHMKSYIKMLLTDLKKADVDDYLKSHGFTSEKALAMLLKPVDDMCSVLEKSTKIKTGKDGKDTFVISYKLPRKDFKKKMQHIFVNEVEGDKLLNEDYDYERALMSTPPCFKEGEKVISQCKPGSVGDRFASYVNNNENNYTPHFFTNEDEMIKEIEEMDMDNAYKNRGGLNKKPVKECTDAAVCNDNAPITPLTREPIKRNILPNKNKKKSMLLTQEQLDYIKGKMLEEEDGASCAGGGENNNAYDANCGIGNDPEVLDHNGICKDPNLLKGGVTGMNEGKKLGCRKKINEISDQMKYNAMIGSALKSKELSKVDKGESERKSRQLDNFYKNVNEKSDFFNDNTATITMILAPGGTEMGEENFVYGVVKIRQKINASYGDYDSYYIEYDLDNHTIKEKEGEKIGRILQNVSQQALNAYNQAKRYVKKIILGYANRGEYTIGDDMKNRYYNIGDAMRASVKNGRGEKVEKVYPINKE